MNHIWWRCIVMFWSWCVVFKYCNNVFRHHQSSWNNIPLLDITYLIVCCHVMLPTFPTRCDCISHHNAYPFLHVKKITFVSIFFQLGIFINNSINCVNFIIVFFPLFVSVSKMVAQYIIRTKLVIVARSTFWPSLHCYFNYPLDASIDGALSFSWLLFYWLQG